MPTRDSTHVALVGLRTSVFFPTGHAALANTCTHTDARALLSCIVHTHLHHTEVFSPCMDGSLATCSKGCVLSPMKLSLTYVKNTQKWKGDNTVAVVAPSKDTHHALCGFLAPTLRASLVLWNGDFGLEALWKYNMHAWKCT